MGSELVTQTLEQLNLQDLISRLEDIITNSDQILSVEEKSAIVQDVIVPRISEIRLHYQSKFLVLGTMDSAEKAYEYQSQHCFGFADILLFSINNCPNQDDSFQNEFYALATDFVELLVSLLVHYPDPTTQEIFEVLVNLHNKGLPEDEFVSTIDKVSSGFNIDSFTYIGDVLEGYLANLLNSLTKEDVDESKLIVIKKKLTILLQFINAILVPLENSHQKNNLQLLLLVCQLHRVLLHSSIDEITIAETVPEAVNEFEQWLSTKYPQMIQLLVAAIESQDKSASTSTYFTPHQIVEFSRFSLTSIDGNSSISDELRERFSEQISNSWINLLSSNNQLPEIYRLRFISDLFLIGNTETQGIAAQALISRLDIPELKLGDAYALLNSWKLGPIGDDDPSKDFAEIINSNVIQMQRLESQAKGSALWLHRHCGIAYFSRYPEALLVRQFNRDKEAYSNPDAPSPFPRRKRRAILVTAYNDHNGAFDSVRSTMSDLFPTLGNSDVSIFEFGWSHQLHAVLSDYRKIFGRVDFLLLSGHGTDTSVMLGNPQSIEHDIRIKNIFLGLVAQPKQFFSKDALVILNSCSTAKSRAKGTRITSNHPARNTSESAKSLDRNKYDYISTKPKVALSGVANIAVAMAKKFGVKVIGPECDSAIAKITYSNTDTVNSFALPTSVEYKYFDDISGNPPPTPIGVGRIIEAPKSLVSRNVRNYVRSRKEKIRERQSGNQLQSRSSTLINHD